jgi:hypothetical protein
MALNCVNTSKGFYGLKHGGREWFCCLEEVLVELAFARIRSDSSVFIWEKDGVKVIVPANRSHTP